MAPGFHVFIATSLDGFIARRNHGLDWLQSGGQPVEDYGYRSFFDAVDTVLLGRNTYDVVRKFDSWPYEGKRCAVVTHRPAAALHGEQFLEGPPQELARQLESIGASRVYVDGGVLIRQFLDAGLVKELTLSVIPVLLGDGIPLFGGAPRDVQLERVGFRAFDSGLVQLTYRPR